MPSIRLFQVAALFLGAALLLGTPVLGARTAGIKGSAELECQVDWPDPDYVASGAAKLSHVRSCYNCLPGGSLFGGTISVQCHDLTPGETYIVYAYPTSPFCSASFTASARGAGGVASGISWVGAIREIEVDVVRSDGEWVLGGVIVLEYGH